jgi:hypothetical protein
LTPKHLGLAGKGGIGEFFAKISDNAGSIFGKLPTFGKFGQTALT